MDGNLRWLAALSLLSAPMVVDAEIVEVTLSGTIDSAGGGYTSPTIGVGTTYTWDFSYDSTVSAAPFPGCLLPVVALNPFRSSTLIAGSNTWTLPSIWPGCNFPVITL